jgi:hypothetical protein
MVGVTEHLTIACREHNIPPLFTSHQFHPSPVALFVLSAFSSGIPVIRDSLKGCWINIAEGIQMMP